MFTKTFILARDGLEDVKAEVSFSVENDSFDYSFGSEDKTEQLPDYILVEDVVVDGRDISDEELKEIYLTSREEIARELEREFG